MKIIVFGVGKFYQNKKEVIRKNSEVVAFIDNSIEKQNKDFEGKKIYQVEKITELKYDFIVIMSAKFIEMRKQLIELGIAKDKIYSWYKYEALIYKNDSIKYEVEFSNAKKVLIFVAIANYSGGFIAALNLAICLKLLNYSVTIVAPIADEGIVDEIIDKGINLWIYPSVLFEFDFSEKEIKKYDFIWCNSLQTLNVASSVAKKCNVFLWLHEYDEQYKDIPPIYGFEELPKEIENIKLLAVSDIARKAFLSTFSNYDIGILPLGVMDMCGDKISEKKSDKIVISIIAGIYKLKNQLFVSKVLNGLSDKQKQKIELWFVGASSTNAYQQELVEYSKNKSYIKFIGKKSRVEMKTLFEQIDVVICPSLVETMSISLIEGLMNSKICITNSNTGVATYIENEKNGFVFHDCNEIELKGIVEQIIEKIDCMTEIKKNARETYVNEFSINSFEKRIKSLIDEMNNNRSRYNEI